MGFDGVQLWLGCNSNSNRTQTATASGLYSFLMTYHKRHLEYHVCQFHLSSAAPNCPGPWKPQRRKRKRNGKKKKKLQGMHLLGFRDACFSPPPFGDRLLTISSTARSLFDGGLSWPVCALRRSRGVLPISDCSCVSVQHEAPRLLGRVWVAG